MDVIPKKEYITIEELQERLLLGTLTKYSYKTKIGRLGEDSIIIVTEDKLGFYVIRTYKNKNTSINLYEYNVEERKFYVRYLIHGGEYEEVI